MTRCAGKVRYLGCSNLFGWQIAKANGVSARLNLEGLVAGQYLYNLIHREPEREIVPAAVDHGLGIVPHSPLGGGLLTGKYKDMDEPAAGISLSYRTGVDGPRFWHPKGFRPPRSCKRWRRRWGFPCGSWPSPGP